MKTASLIVMRLLLAGMALSSLSVQAQQAAVETAGLALIAELGQLNGAALACSEKLAAQRAKMLMLAYAPKTQRYGETYEQATQQGFLARTQERAPCLPPRELERDIESIADRLHAMFPPAPVLKPAVAE